LTLLPNEILILFERQFRLSVSVIKVSLTLPLNANAWAQAASDKTKVNNITLTYASEVFIKSVTVRESFNAGTISKLEVLI
jgi:hypothetical protein